MSEKTEKSIYAKANHLHEQYRGKIEMVSKCSVREMADFAHWYTPGVAEPCREISKKPELVNRYTNRGNSVAIVSDGTRVLGLGNIGAKAAMPVMEGKALIFKYLGGVDAIPVCLDETDPVKFASIVRALEPTFGGFNLEDIESPKCYGILSSLEASLSVPVWHDDRKGTATVILAGALSACKLTNRDISKVKVTLFGAGAANLAVADMLFAAGCPVGNIILVDKDGIINKNSEIPANNRLLMKWAEISNEDNLTGGINEAVKGADILIAFSIPGPDVISPDSIKLMNHDPIVFACANPVPEIWPEVAHSAGAAITATGRSDFPNQLNNAIVFPGVFRGALDVGATAISDEMCLAAANAICKRTEEIGLRPDFIVPPLEDMEVTAKVAEAVGFEACNSNLSPLNLSRQEIYNSALEKIKRARLQITTLMDSGVILPPKL